LSDDELIEARAARWLAARDAGTATPAETDEFNRWLDGDIRHRVAYLRLESSWRRADRLADLRPLDRPVDPDLLVQSKPRRAWPLALAASTLVGLLGALWVYQQHFSWQRYETPIGGFSRIVLEDGSVVDLNTDSAMRVRLDSGRREIQLDRGEGRFQVAHDARRPFTVAAADAAVRAVGTAFTVRVHDSHQVDVLVSEGKVAVAAPNGVAGTKGTSELAAGEAAVVLPDRVAVSRVEPQLMARRLAWTSGRLDFRGESLRDAVAEFNRYNRRQVRLADDALATLRVGGSFAATDPESFAAALASAFRLRVDEHETEIVLRSPE
jgi:transmembrane sensor